MLKHNLKAWLINWLTVHLQLYRSEDLVRERQLGYDEGYKKGTERSQRTPGWLRDQVHRKLNLMFKTDQFSNRARYRWLHQHSLTTSHMSRMSYDELSKINKMLDESIGNHEAT